MEHPGALTESDLVSWNWSSHGDSSLSYGDTGSLTHGYSDIIKQISEADYDSGKESDDVQDKHNFVEVCEEETQVGHSLLNIPTPEVTMSDKSEDSTESENEQQTRENNANDTDYDQFKKDFEQEFYKQLDESKTEQENTEVEFEEFNVDNNDNTVNETVNKDSDENEPDIENYSVYVDTSEIYNDKDRMLSDISVKTPKDTVSVTLKHDNKKKEKIEVPDGEAVISGPLQVCLSLGSEWKRRYLTVVNNCLYIWTSHK